MASDLGSSSCSAVCLSVTCTRPTHVLFSVITCLLVVFSKETDTFLRVL